MIRKSKLKKIINEEIKEILSNPPSHSFDKSNRKIINNQDKIELLKNEYVIIDREIKKIQKLINNGEGNIEDLQNRINKNTNIKKEIENQIQKLQ